MKQPLRLLTTGALAFAAHNAHAQYSAPPQPSFAGFLNEYLRGTDPQWQKWDFGAQLRVRYEVKDNAGFTFRGAATDFHKNLAAGTDNENSYYLTKLLVRAGYTDTWWSAFVQGRQSASTGEGGGFYVCGDASRMAKDVDAALHQVIQTAGGKRAEEATAYVAALQKDKRYQRDVY